MKRIEELNTLIKDFRVVRYNPRFQILINKGQLDGLDHYDKTHHIKDITYEINWELRNGNIFI